MESLKFVSLKARISGEVIKEKIQSEQYNSKTVLQSYTI